MKNIKHISIIILLGFIVVSCKPEPIEEYTFDPETKLLIKATAAPSTKKANTELSYAHLIDSLGYERFAMFYGIDYQIYYPNGYEGTDSIGNSATGYFSLGEDFLLDRDTVNKKFIIWGMNVCASVPSETEFGKYDVILGNFIHWQSVVLRVSIDSAGNLIHASRSSHDVLDAARQDTIGYIPRQMIKEGVAKVKVAFAKKDYEECYRILKNTFEFKQITGPEYLELMRQDKH